MRDSLNNIGSRPVVILLLLLLILLGPVMCKKFEPERRLLVQTDSILGVQPKSFTVKGSIVFLGNDAIVQHGFCYSESSEPNLEHGAKNELGSRNSAGEYESTIAGLMASTTYYVRAYAADQEETVYGKVVSFKTTAQLATVHTTSVSNIASGSATSGGTVSSDGGAEVVARGVCWSTNPVPLVSGSHTTNGTGTGSYTSAIESLECGAKYYVTAYATNSEGTAYGDILIFNSGQCVGGVPEVTTSTASSVTETTALSGGNVTSSGSSAVSERGVCWSTSMDPNLEDEFKQSGSGTGNFTVAIDGLTCNTTYYVRAYAKNESGISFGSSDVFTTLQCSSDLPSLTTLPVDNIGETGATSGGTITSDGGAPVTARGVCWSITEEPTLSDPHTENGSGSGAFTSNLTGLTGDTRYYVKAYATNSSGTAFGGQVMFTTDSPTAPEVTTATVIDITESTATSGGNVSSEGSNPVTARGVCWNTSGSPVNKDEHTSDGAGVGVFTSSLTNLSCGTTYYLRAYAVSSSGPAYGAQEVFTTADCPAGIPVVSTAAISNVTETSAQSGGEVTSDGGETVTARGVCWSISPTPDITDLITSNGDGIGSYTSDLTELSANTTYYVRAYATNSLGTSYGGEVSFNSNNEQVADYDGNTYPIVVIGDQVWMGENLRTTHYSDGTAIPLIENNSMWDALSDTDDAYCWNDNNATTGSVYGALYTWAAAMNGEGSTDANPSAVQGVCPSSWHLPSDAEWKELEEELGMIPSDAEATGWRGTVQGGLLKESGTDHWNNPNTGANNNSGFTALPGGNRYDYGTFLNVGSVALLWTSMDKSTTNAFGRSLSYNIAKVYRGDYAKSNGFSVRCIRDY